MAKMLCGAGCRGEIVMRIQAQLLAGGFLKRKPDGVYGDVTAAAVRAFQDARQISVSGAVDQETWAALLNVPTPDVQQRSLQVTAAFEGHGFGLAQGNFDGAGITWGIIGFTLKDGDIARLLTGIEDSNPELLREAFGDGSDELLDVLTRPWPDQLAWADNLSGGPGNATLAEPWLSGFSRLGAMPAVQEAQLERVEQDYFAPSRRTAAAYGLRSELGRALAFDIHVQNGSINPDAAAQIKQARAQSVPETERDVRILIANAVADNAKADYQADVRSRKLTLATGEGTVHGRHFILASWGLDDSPASP